LLGFKVLSKVRGHASTFRLQSFWNILLDLFLLLPNLLTLRSKDFRHPVMRVYLWPESDPLKLLLGHLLEPLPLPPLLLLLQLLRLRIELLKRGYC
jgi:hypothetical protein